MLARTCEQFRRVEASKSRGKSCKCAELNIGVFDVPVCGVSYCWLYRTCFATCTRNHQGRRGNIADIGDNLLPSLTVLGWSLTAVEVWVCPLSEVMLASHRLFCLPIFLYPGTVPSTIFYRDHLILPHVQTIEFSLSSQLIAALRRDRWLSVSYCALPHWHMFANILEHTFALLHRRIDSDICSWSSMHV